MPRIRTTRDPILVLRLLEAVERDIDEGCVDYAVYEVGDEAYLVADYGNVRVMFVVRGDPDSNDGDAYVVVEEDGRL